MGDLASRLLPWARGDRAQIRLSQLVTALVGVFAVLLAARFRTVLDAILYAYAFMVSGLLVPTLGVFYLRHGDGRAATASMLAGGGFSLAAIVAGLDLPGGLDPAFYGILLSLAVYLAVAAVRPRRWAA